MSNSQCLPCYNKSFLKEDCQPIGNGGQLFTDNRPSQELLSVIMQKNKNNNKVRQQMIHSGEYQIKKNQCNSINNVRCHYMDIPELPTYCNKIV